MMRYLVERNLDRLLASHDILDLVGTEDKDQHLPLSIVFLQLIHFEDRVTL